MYITKKPRQKPAAVIEGFPQLPYNEDASNDSVEELFN